MFIHWYLFAFNYYLLKGCTAQSRTLTEILQNYETLNKEDITHRIVRRSVKNEINRSHVRHLDFHSHEHDFHLELVPSQMIFAPNFMAVAVDSHGVEKTINVTQEDYYTGFLKDEDNSSVTAHIEDGMITASITTSNDTFFIEPMGRHVGENNTASHDMIIYKVTDMNWNLTHVNSSARVNHPSTCNANGTKKYIIKDGLLEEQTRDSSEFHTYLGEDEPLKRSRKRRNVVTSKNMCDLVLVCDHLFFKKMGSLKSAAVNYMLQVASRVNTIYIGTDWPGLGKGIGFQVKKVIVHTSASAEKGPRYNQITPGVWNVHRLLEEFSRSNWRKYCLAHLFTHQDFADSVIGLAYIGSPSITEFRGICAEKDRDNVGDRFLNCGLSSNINRGRPLLTVEAELVTAHEFGHNFGSNHDPSSCNSDSTDGKYIMYAYSVAGDKRNNYIFSSCSRNAIAAVLKSKRNLCFSDREEIFCGNGKVEEGEKCDAGLDENDPCCNLQCQLRPDKNCSDSNSLCCKDCFYAPNTTICRVKFEYECRDETKCSGFDVECPNITYLSGRENCGLSKGKCVNGKNCSSLCKINDKISCLCSAGANACKVCCQDSNSSSCIPLLNGGNENDGIPCFLQDREQGYCIKGKCEKAQQKVGGLLKDFSFGKFARFMEENIVGTVLVFSLFVWLPAGCIVHYLDKKQDEEHEEMKLWSKPFSRELIQKATPSKLDVLFQLRSVPEQKLPRTLYHISS